MMRFLAFVGRAPDVFKAPTGWRRHHAGPMSSIWGPEEPRAAASIEGGCLFGVLARPAASMSELKAAWGAYVAFVESSEGVTVLRDPSGRVPAFIVDAGSHQLVCSHIEDALRYLGAAPDLDWRHLVSLLLGGVTPGRATGFRSVQQLAPGEAWTFRGGASGFETIWNPPTFWNKPFRTLAEAHEALRAAAEDSVRFWAGRYQSVTIDLSGGLDSSALIALLARHKEDLQITAINARISHLESDERRFARIAAAAAGVPLVEVDIGQDLPSYADAPPQALQPRPTPQLRRLGLDLAALPIGASAGAQAYFTGRGGDHLFYDHPPTLAARDLLAARPGPGRFLAAALELARVTRQPLARVIRDAFAPPRNARDVAGLVRSDNPLVTPEAAAAVRLEDIAHPWVLEAARSAPLGKIRQLHLLAELQRHYDRVERAAVMDEVHPFISQPMIEASLRTPSWMFASGGLQRGLQRAVFADVLPPEILARRTKGATTSHSTRTLLRNLPYLREKLLEGQLVREGVLDRARLESALTPAALVDGRARPSVMDCVMVQLWLDQAREVLMRTRDAGKRDPAAHTPPLVPGRN